MYPVYITIMPKSSNFVQKRFDIIFQLNVKILFQIFRQTTLATILFKRSSNTFNLHCNKCTIRSSLSTPRNPKVYPLNLNHSSSPTSPPHSKMLGAAPHGMGMRKNISSPEIDHLPDLINEQM